MVFKRLLGMGGIPLEIDTVIQSDPALPGGLLRGEVVLRAPDRRVEVKSIYLRLVTDAPVAHKGDGPGPPRRPVALRHLADVTTPPVSTTWAGRASGGTRSSGSSPG